MNPIVTLVMLIAMVLGTTITMMSSHWLLAWIGLEMNTLAMLPLMSKKHHPRAVEASTKYFLVQATASTILLSASMTNAWFMGQWDILQMTHPIPASMLTLALALKIGIAPLHTWLPDVLQGLDLTTGLILSTWQKLAPFALLLQIYPVNSYLLITLGVASTLVGGWGGLNQTQLRKILAYSSIAHLGWMITILQFAPSLTLLALTTYLIMTTSAFLSLTLYKATNINMLATSWTKSPVLSTMIPLILLSLAGLPPLLGFMPKWLILQELTKQGLLTIAVLIALTALLTLFFYLRLSFALALTMSPNMVSNMQSWRLPHNKHTLPLAVTTSLTALLLPLTPTIKTVLGLL
uniref:NADH-ubiquinone oxidoreductase chain 2 n=1 Tax=Taeniacara candidi TaxID=97002 RepID=A0A1L2BHN3_9CICH|nr:NADH dehydrogenase subunit 2 [Taeniacara candidi]